MRMIPYVFHLRLQIHFMSCFWYQLCTPQAGISAQSVFRVIRNWRTLPLQISTISCPQFLIARNKKPNNYDFFPRTSRVPAAAWMVPWCLHERSKPAMMKAKSAKSTPAQRPTKLWHRLREQLENSIISWIEMLMLILKTRWVILKRKTEKKRKNTDDESYS